MQAERIFFLKEEIEKFPDEPFNYYALALESLKHQNEYALELFELLLSKFPDYLPTYYQAANHYFEIGEIDKAGQTFRNGIEVAEKQGKTKALSELKGSYQLYLDEIEE